MTDWSAAPAPSLDDIALLAQDAYARLPGAFRRMAGDVLFRVEDFADEEVLAVFEMEDPFELTGLYQGVDLARRSVLDPAPQAPMVFLYRRPILDEWAERGDVTIADLIAHVTIHEFAHHFGWSDDDIAAIDQWWH